MPQNWFMLFVIVAISCLVTLVQSQTSAAVLSDACPDGSANFLYNGDFEVNGTFASFYPNGTLNIAGWTVTNGSTETDFGPYTWTPYSGNWSSDLSGQSPGSMYQIITDFTGLAGSVSFALGGNFYNSPTIKTGTVAVYALCSPSDPIESWTLITDQTLTFDTSNSGPNNMNWAFGNMTFPGASDATTYAIQFTSTTDSGNGPVIDYVRVCPSDAVFPLYNLGCPSASPSVSPSALPPSASPSPNGNGGGGGNQGSSFSPSLVPSYSYSATVAPTVCSTPTPSPTCGVVTPSASPCANSDDDDGVTINFYFADMLNGIRG